MSVSSQRRRKAKGWSRPALIAMAVALALCAGVVVAVGLSQQESAPPKASTAAPPAPPSVPSDEEQQADTGGAPAGSGDSGGGGSPAVEPLDASPPQRIDIPKLKVSTTMVNLGLDGKKAMETPKGPDKAGWYEPGPAPGAKGPAVIAAHVTWDRKPAVFFRLGELRKGDTVEVARQDGRTAVFTVDRVARYAKDRFPTIEVYRNVDHAALRLITCGGEFSTATNRYSDNVVVYAKLTGTK